MGDVKQISPYVRELPTRRNKAAQATPGDIMGSEDRVIKAISKMCRYNIYGSVVSS